MDYFWCGEHSGGAERRVHQTLAEIAPGWQVLARVGYLDTDKLVQAAPASRALDRAGFYEPSRRRDGVVRQ